MENNKSQDFKNKLDKILVKLGQIKEINIGHSKNLEQQLLKSVQYLINEFPTLHDILKSRDLKIQEICCNHLVFQLICEHKSLQCINILCSTINKFEIADSSLILNPSEDIKKIWILLEKLFEFNNELVSYGCKNEFTFKILSEFYNCTLIKDLAQKNTNISNSILKFDQVLYDLKQNAKQIWRYLLPIGQDVYINEFNNDEDNTNQSMILGKIGRKLSDFNALVICFLDDTGTERNEIIGRWSNRLCLPQIEHELIQQWRQNLQVGHQLLALHEGQKKKTIFSSTILSVAYSSQQILEKIKIGYRIYSQYGNQADDRGKYFGSKVMNINGEIFEDEWVEVSSFKIIPISIFEAHQGSLELVKFLTEEIRTQDFKYIDINLPLSKEQINQFLGTPLYNACSSGRLEIAQYLMKVDWQINYRTFQDLSPFKIVDK
eukprot:403368830